MVRLCNTFTARRNVTLSILLALDPTFVAAFAAESAEAGPEYIVEPGTEAVAILALDAMVVVLGTIVAAESG